MRFELREIDLKYAIVVPFRISLGLRIGFKKMPVSLDDRDEIATARRLQVFAHPCVGGKNRCSRAELGAHVGDRRLSGGTDRARSGSDVFDDRVGAAGNTDLSCDAGGGVFPRFPTP